MEAWSLPIDKKKKGEGMRLGGKGGGWGKKMGTCGTLKRAVETGTLLLRQILRHKRESKQTHLPKYLRKARDWRPNRTNQGLAIGVPATLGRPVEKKLK